jgi:flagellar motility protein MotE (MotC chaperone)
MKSHVSIIAATLVLNACFALSVSAQTQHKPTWGWKPEDIAHYQDLLKPKKPEAAAAWDTATVKAPPETPKPPEAKAPPESPSIKAYCQNIEDAALEVRFLNQKNEILRLEGELEKRTAALEAKRAEYQEWLQRRDEFISKAEGGLVALYTKIKPDAAAVQLAALDEEAAAALLMRLKPKSASAILDQMDSAKAARLVSVMIGAAKKPEKPDKNANPETQPGQEKAAAPEAASAGPAAGKEQAAQQPQPAEKKL